MEVETALVELGSYSKWQLEKASAAAILLYGILSFQVYTIVFQGWTPPHECRISLNFTRNQSLPHTIKDNKQVFDQCHVYKIQSPSNDFGVSSSNKTIEGCDEFIYKSDGYETLVTEFDLVCNQAYLPALSQSVFYCGYMLAAIVFGFCSDMFGRKPVAILTAILGAITSLTSLTVTSFTSFIAVRFFVGLFTLGTGISTVPLTSELFPSKQRAFAVCYLFLFWSIGMCLLALVSFFIMSWHHLVILSSCLIIVLAILAIWLTEESIPWLVSNGKGDRAIKILKKAAKRNRVTFSDDTLRNISDAASRSKFNYSLTPEGLGMMPSSSKRLREVKEELKHKLSCFKEEQSSNESIGFKTIFYHRSLRCWTLISMVMWCNTNLVFYGLNYSSSALVGNRFVNFFLLSIVEAPAYFFMYFLIERIGRRFTVFTSFIVTSVFLLTAIVVPKQVNGFDISPVIMVFNMLGKFFVSLGYSAIYAYTQEYFPTSIRARGLGICSFAARIGAILSPFSEYVARYSSVTLGLVLGTLAVVNGLLSLLLPETRGKPMPQDMDDIDRLGFFKFNCLKKEQAECCDNLESAPISGFDEEHV